MLMTQLALKARADGLWARQAHLPGVCCCSVAQSYSQHSFDGILQWAIQSMSRPLAEAPTFPS